jgi:hypothetical protein
MTRDKNPGSVDFMGKDIKVGDIIVYPVRRRSDMTLKKATVFEAPGFGCVVKKGIVALNDEGRRVIIEKPERCAVVSNISERNSDA